MQLIWIILKGLAYYDFDSYQYIIHVMIFLYEIIITITFAVAIDEFKKIFEIVPINRFKHTTYTNKHNRK